MNILVTGAGGLLGSTLINELSQKHTVYAIVHTLSEKSDQLESVHYIEEDLAQLDINRLPSDIEVVYYLAQSNHFREFPEGAIDMFNINIRAALYLADWSQKNGIKQFFYASSGGVYKNPVKPVKEFFDINANGKNGFYLDSKLSAEILLKNYSALFETFVILRPFFMYGPGQKHSMLIPRLIDNVKNKKLITLNGQNGIHINPIYIDDAVATCKQLLTLKGEYIFNIAGSEEVSLRQLAEMIGKVVAEKPMFENNDQVQNDLIADISLMQEKLHIPQVRLREGLARTFESMGI